MIEPVWIGIDGRVAVGRAKKAQNRVALLDVLTAHVHVLKRAPGDLNRDFVSQKLIDRCLKRRIALEELELIGIAMKRQKGISDQMDRGDMAGHI